MRRRTHEKVRQYLEVMKVDNILLDTLAAQAQASLRMLNALEPRTVLPVHRYRGTAETMVVLRGRVVEEYYSSEGDVEAEFELAAGGPVCALNIPVGQWHTLRALDPGTVILEMKDGPYEPIQECDILK